MPSLLLIDDDKEVLTINSKYFKQLNYEIKAVTNARNALTLLKNYSPDCIVMDVMMPGMDGFQACTKIKEICSAPIIFLTGKDTEDDKIQGLLLGADDYMVKPYSLRELEVRIQVLIRRYQNVPATDKSNILAYPPLRLDLNKHKAYYNEDEISLSNKEYDLLYLLAASPNRVFTFEEIGNAIWNTYLESDRKTIMVTASRLRKKLDAYPGLSRFIETVWSQGYQFVTK